MYIYIYVSIYMYIYVYKYIYVYINRVTFAIDSFLGLAIDPFLRMPWKKGALAAAGPAPFWGARAHVHYG